MIGAVRPRVIRPRVSAVTLNSERDFDFVHADPRYAALLRRMGLPGVDHVSVKPAGEVPL
jgi:hypothetical protein